jgi:outer membrane protein OmpA-like peptidoglycan-associated protein
MAGVGRQVLWVAPLVLSTALVGCATKKFVREEVGRSEVKLGQEVQRLEADLGQEKTRLGGVATQVTETRAIADEATRQVAQAAGLATEAATKAEAAGTQATQAMSRADEARGLATQAIATADQTDARLTRLWSNRSKRTLGDTIVITFGFDRWQLDDRAETALLDVAKQLQDNPGLTAELEGYTDNVGPNPYNLQLSQRRAEAVRRFLVEKGVGLNRIHSIGLGDARPVADNKTRQGRDQNRRVSVKLFAPVE